MAERNTKPAVVIGLILLVTRLLNTVTEIETIATVIVGASVANDGPHGASAEVNAELRIPVCFTILDYRILDILDADAVPGKLRAMQFRITGRLT